MTLTTLFPSFLHRPSICRTIFQQLKLKMLNSPCDATLTTQKCHISSIIRRQTVKNRNSPVGICLRNSLPLVDRLPLTERLEDSSVHRRGYVSKKCLWNSLPLVDRLPLAERLDNCSLHRRGYVSKKCLWNSLPLVDRRDDGSAHRRSYVSKKDYPFCEVKEEDLEEDFVRGSGPGGQAVNQTANCVVLKHVPTGIVVKCHETRSQHKNRQLARERLKERLDLRLNGPDSFLAQRQEEASLVRKEKKKKNRTRLELKKAFKEREGID